MQVEIFKCDEKGSAVSRADQKERKKESGHFFNSSLPRHPLPCPNIMLISNNS
jgi:hypothetical protein